MYNNQFLKIPWLDEVKFFQSITPLLLLLLHSYSQYDQQYDYMTLREWNNIMLFSVYMYHYIISISFHIEYEKTVERITRRGEERRGEEREWDNITEINITDAFNRIKE